MGYKNNKNSASIIPRDPPGKSNQTNKVENTITTTFSIEGMTCLSCARKVEEALDGLPGVKTVKVDFGHREAIIEYNQEEVTSNELKTVVQTLGYRLIQKKVGNLEETENQPKRWIGLKPYLFGAVAGFGVVGFYLGLLTLTSDWYNARLEFKHFGPWILALAVGLGVQVCLFSFYRAWHKGKSMKTAKYSLAASGGLSTTAMAACCSHYLAIILPVLGLPFLSAAVAGLADYQTYFFLIGVLSNLFGIGLMLRMMDRSGMIQLKDGLSRRLFKPQQLKS